MKITIVNSWGPDWEDDVDVHEARMALFYAHLQDIAPTGVDPKILEELVDDAEDND